MAVKIYAINIGSNNAADQSGDAIIIENNGVFGMIDAGGCSSQAVADQYGDQNVSYYTAGDGDKVRPFMRSLGIVQLEWLIITHFHSDHAWWLSQVIDDFNPKNVYGFNPINMGNPLAPKEYQTKANAFYYTDGMMSMTMDALARQTPPKPLINPTEGQYIMLGSDVTFNFLNTDAAKNGALLYGDYNYASLMLLMKYGTTKVMFFSDSRFETSESIITNIVGKCHVAFAPHHGIIFNASETLVTKVDADLAVFTKFRNWLVDTSADWFQHTGSRLLHFDADFSIPMTIELDNVGGFTVVSGKEEKLMNRWYKWQGTWFYFNAAGDRQKGWATISGAKYYFNSVGGMVKGWYQDTDTNWYYLEPTAGGAYGYDKVTFFKEGQMHTNDWVLSNSKWYWLKADGKMARSESILIGTKTYNFDANGVCLNP